MLACVKSGAMIPVGGHAKAAKLHTAVSSEFDKSGKAGKESI